VCLALLADSISGKAAGCEMCESIKEFSSAPEKERMS
jgi:hypothetical protein